MVHVLPTNYHLLAAKQVQYQKKKEKDQKEQQDSAEEQESSEKSGIKWQPAACKRPATPDGVL